MLLKLNSEALLGVNFCVKLVTINVPRGQILHRQQLSVQQILIDGSQTFSESNIYRKYSRVFEGPGRVPL